MYRGIAAVPGNAIPRVSMIQAIALAVPMTAQVPDVVTNLDSIFSMPALSISAAPILPKTVGSQCMRQVFRPPNALSIGAGN